MMDHKVGRSTFTRGVTIHTDVEKSFIRMYGREKSMDIKIIWGKITYNGKLRWWPRYGLHQLLWESDIKLQHRLKKQFSVSYFSFIMDRWKRPGQKKSIGKGQREILIIEPINVNMIRLYVGKTIEEKKYKPLFEMLIDQNIESEISGKSSIQIVKKPMGWLPRSKLRTSRHYEVTGVIYYLVDRDNELLYIGSTRKKLGDRLKTVYKEIPNWYKFRYDIVRTEHLEHLEGIETLTIIAFAKIFKNKLVSKMKLRPLGGRNGIVAPTWTLVNKQLLRLDK
jgi:hypothetical protein